MSSSKLYRNRMWMGVSALGVALALSAATAYAQPVAVVPYTLATFKGVPPAGATAPDDLAVSADGTDLWVGYGNGVDSTGAGGPSTVVEYDISTGAVLRSLSIPGHVDGLKLNPVTSDIWATENEDGNPTLAVIKPRTGKFTIFKFSPTLLTGGLDDLVFTGREPQDVFFVASSQIATSSPVIVQLSGGLKLNNTVVTSFLSGNPTSVFNVVTNTTETNDVIGDPDSMTVDPVGELVLDNRSDLSLYIVRSATSTNPVLRVPLTLGNTGVEVNDTVFANSSIGTLFITDTSANVIYTLTKPYFPPGEVYTAANKVGDVGLVNLTTGVVTPVVTGLTSPHGLHFVRTPVAIAPRFF